MKSLFIFAVISFLTKNPDITYLGSLRPFETKPVKVTVFPGNFDIQVFSKQEYSLISCKYLDGAGNIGLEQKLTNRCIGKIKSTQKGAITVIITNENSTPIDYNVLVHDSSK